ncbi:MAG: ribonuclease R, partial [Oscillospiraceae bacterium]
MSIKAKIMAEIEKRPRRLKELKAKLGNDKKVMRAVDELVKSQKLTSTADGIYSVKLQKAVDAVKCNIVKLGKGFGF